MTDILFETADRYENRFNLSSEERFQIHEHLDLAILNFLIQWAASIPEAAKRRYSLSLDRALYFITKRRFTLRGVFLTDRDISVKYTNESRTVYQITILPQKVLLYDVEHNNREAAFPVTWAPESFYWLPCRNRKEKVELYMKFLASKTHRWLIIVGSTPDEREPFLRAIGRSQSDLILLEEGCESCMIPHSEPYNIYDEYPITKTVVFRNQHDMLSNAFHYTERDRALCAEFVSS
jgi:hypothetical protein